MNYAPDLATAAVKMVFSLGIVLLIVWGLYRLVKSKLPMNAVGGKMRFIKIVDSQYLGVKKSIALVQVPGSVLVLGIGSDNVNLLAQIDDPDILNSIQTTHSKRRALNFKDQLHRLVKPQDKNGSDFHNEAATG